MADPLDLLGLTPNEKKLHNQVTDCLKSILTALGGEAPMDKLITEYRKVVGEDIPFKLFKHGTVASFLQSINWIMRLQNRGGELHVKMVKDRDLENLQRMVREQKSERKAPKNHQPARHPRGPSAWVPTRTAARINQGQRPVRPSQGCDQAPKPNTAKTNVLTRPNDPKFNFPPYGAKQFPPKQTNLPQQPETFETKSLKSGHYYDDGNFILPRAIRGNQEKQFAPYYEVPPRFNMKNAEGKPVGKTHKQKLEEEVKRLNINETAIFRTIPWGKKKRSWVSTLTIGKIQVSSYPKDMEKPEDAEESVAKEALPLIQQMIRQKLPVTTDQDLLIKRIKELLRKDNMWSESVQELYQEHYQEVLPDDWLQKIQSMKNCGISVENHCSDRWTLKIKEAEVNEPRSFSDVKKVREWVEPWGMNGELPLLRSCSVKPDTVSKQEVHLQLPPLKLPCSSFWDIFIRHIEDLSNIYFHLVGDEYSGAYSELATNMELHYMEEKNLAPVKNPQEGELYAASHDQSWFRVELLNVCGHTVEVRFVDHGDEEVIELTELHYLHKKFFDLPAQILKCSMAGLEYAKKNAGALALLQDLALGETLVAQIINRQEPVSVILFNTMTDEDININQKISDHIQMNFVEPVLPVAGGIAEVYLLHVTPMGDLYVQIESETYKVLEDLLDVARNRTAEMLGEDVNIDLTRLYLARFSEDGEWYRAAPRSNVDPDGKVQMWFVDFGNSDRVELSKIRRLDSVCDQLTKIPHQALRCRLYNVPPHSGHHWTPRACQRLLELAPDNTPLLLRVQDSGINGGPPSVELFKRSHPQNELVSINFTLSMDTSLFSDGDRNNNSANKEAIPNSSSLCRQSSLSSQSSSSHGNSGPSSISSQHDSSAGSPRSSRTNSPLTSFSRQKIPGALVPQEIPAVGSYFDVFVTFAANPSNFAVQSYKMTSKLSSLMCEMQSYYDSTGKELSAIEVGEFFAVKHNDDTWYRAHTTMVQDGIVTGLFVDYGDCFVTSQDRVQELPNFFRELPYQAIKAKLHGIVPVNVDWSIEDSRRFQDLVELREFVSLVMEVEEDSESCVVLSLQLINTTDEKLDIYIDQILLDEGRAVKKAKC